MKSRALKRFCSSTGETIAETLVALLVSSLALVMLAGAISAASQIVLRSKQVMNQYYAACNQLGTRQESTGNTIQVTLTEGEGVDKKTVNLPGGSGETKSVAYAFTQLSQKPVIAYNLVLTGGSAPGGGEGGSGS